jgi:hypothetical protein
LENDLNRHFSKEIQVANKPMKNCYQENASENCNELSSHAVRMAITKKTKKKWMW